MRVDPASLSEIAPGTLVVERAFPPISRHILALYCGASGDPNPIHVDSDYARAAGFPDVFAHGMLVMAYAGLMLEEAAPVEGLKSFSVRFVAITQLHARIMCEARVAGESGGYHQLEIVARDQDGEIKLQGEASVSRSWLEACNGQA